MRAAELLNYKNWVVVGDVLNESKYASRILHSLRGAGFNTSGVNPRVTTGEAYNNLSEVPYKIEVIDLCINPYSGINIMKEALELKIDKVLIQPGAESQEIIGFCKANGITAIEGCALVELSSYRG